MKKLYAAEVWMWVAEGTWQSCRSVRLLRDSETLRFVCQTAEDGREEELSCYHMSSCAQRGHLGNSLVSHNHALQFMSIMFENGCKAKSLTQAKALFKAFAGRCSPRLQMSIQSLLIWQQLTDRAENRSNRQKTSKLRMSLWSAFCFCCILLWISLTLGLKQKTLTFASSDLVFKIRCRYFALALRVKLTLVLCRTIYKKF